MADALGYGNPQQYQNVSEWAKARRLRPPLEVWKDDFESSVKSFAREQDNLVKQRTRIAAYAAVGIFFFLLFEGYLAYFAS